MQKHFLKFRKVLPNISLYTLILISINSELAAKYLHNDKKQSTTSGDIKKTNNGLFQGFNIKKDENILITENKENISQDSVLISEIIIEGWENHPEGRRLELAAYDSMSIKPGSIVDNRMLNKDINAIYASGWFS